MPLATQKVLDVIMVISCWIYRVSCVRAYIEIKPQNSYFYKAYLIVASLRLKSPHHAETQQGIPFFIRIPDYIEFSTKKKRQFTLYFDNTKGQKRFKSFSP